MDSPDKTKQVSPMARDFAMRLSKLRMQKGVTARDMSLSLGQNPGYINAVENCKAMPSMNAFFLICEYLEVTPEEFFAIEQTNPYKVKKLIDYIIKLDEDNLDHLCALFENFSK